MRSLEACLNKRPCPVYPGRMGVRGRTESTLVHVCFQKAGTIGLLPPTARSKPRLMPQYHPLCSTNLHGLPAGLAEGCYKQSVKPGAQICQATTSNRAAPLNDGWAREIYHLPRT